MIESTPLEPGLRSAAGLRLIGVGCIQGVCRCLLSWRVYEHA